MSTETETTDDFSSALEAIDKAVAGDRNLEAAKARISQARVDLVLGRDAKAVFFATVAMRLKMEPDPSFPTAATNGKEIRYNPEWVASLTRAEAVGILAHECLHVCQCHHARIGDRDPDLWGIGCDLAINPMLLAAGITLPKTRIVPGEGNFKKYKPGLAAEEYYQLLLKDRPPQPPPPGGGQDGAGEGDAPAPGASDPGKCGGVQKPGKGSQAECRKAEAEGKEMAAAAQQAAEGSGRGNLPGGLGRAVKDILEPKADWKAILREFVSRHSRNDYSWSRPNRRFIHMGLYLPGMHSEELGDVALLVDVSGSIGQETLNRFAAEVRGILESYDCKLTVIYHDHAVQKVVEWRSTDGPLVLEAIGGGGTSHVPAFEHVVRHVADAACICCLTDMESVFPTDPQIPTLWCDISTGHKAPFGRLVSIDK